MLIGKVVPDLLWDRAGAEKAVEASRPEGTELRPTRTAVKPLHHFLAVEGSRAQPSCCPVSGSPEEQTELPSYSLPMQGQKRRKKENTYGDIGSVKVYQSHRRLAPWQYS